MDSIKITRTPVIAYVGNAMLVGDKTIEDGIIKTTFDFIDGVLIACNHGDETYYYYDKTRLPVNNLEDALLFCCGCKKFIVHAVVEGIVVNKKYHNLNEAMKQALDFMEHGEPVSVTDTNGSSYNPVKYWYEA